MRQPYHLPDRQDYAIEQERQRHNDALYAFGEYAIFVLLWDIADLEAGRVGRCLLCYLSKGKVAEVYQQSSDSLCEECYGTTFEGGFKAILVRPSLWDLNEVVEKPAARGKVLDQTVSVQTTHDFRLRTGDYIIRGDGVRYRMRTSSTQRLRTGFAVAEHGDSGLAFNYGSVNREDLSSVVYKIPPSAETVRTRLDVLHAHYPLNFSDLEVIRGPLL